MKSTSLKKQKKSPEIEHELTQPIRWFKSKRCDRLKLQIGYPQSDGDTKWEFISIFYEDPNEKQDFIDKNLRRDSASRQRSNKTKKKLKTKLPIVEVI